jgi:hypothetical protein
MYIVLDYQYFIIFYVFFSQNMAILFFLTKIEPRKKNSIIKHNNETGV